MVLLSLFWIPDRLNPEVWVRVFHVSGARIAASRHFGLTVRSVAHLRKARQRQWRAAFPAALGFVGGNSFLLSACFVRICKLEWIATLLFKLDDMCQP